MYRAKQHITAVAVCLVIILQILPFAAFAADAGERFDFLLSVNGGGSVTVNVGDVVTVRASVSRKDAKEIQMYAVQDGIIFSNEFFELVPDSLVGINEVNCSTKQMAGNWKGWTGISASAFSAKLEGDTWANPIALYTFKLKTKKVGTSVILHQEHAMSTITGLDEYESSATNATVIIKESNTQTVTDIPENEWYSKAVKYTLDKGLFDITSGKFNPTNQSTRGELVLALYRYEGSPGVTRTDRFSDVSKGTELARATEWASDNEIVTGSDGKFYPERTIPREQIAALMFNYAKFKKSDISTNDNLSNFSDSGSISDWARTGLSWAVKQKIFVGDNGKLNPKNAVTRAGVAQILYNCFD
jgi:hypothetical protein